MKTIIDKTEEQLSKANTPAEKVYLSAFLDGAKAQKEEDKKTFENMSTYIGVLEAERETLITTFGECLRVILKEFIDRATTALAHEHIQVGNILNDIRKEMEGEDNVRNSQSKNQNKKSS